MAIICRLRDKTSFSHIFQYTISCWMSRGFHIQTHFCSPSLYFVDCTKLERKSNTMPRSLRLFKQSKSNQTNSRVGNEQEGVKMKKNGLTLKILILSAKVWLGKWKVWPLQSKHVSLGALSHPDQNYREQKREPKTFGRITRGFKTKGRGRLDREET